jgi:hypothetical protein
VYRKKPVVLVPTSHEVFLCIFVNLLRTMRTCFFFGHGTGKSEVAARYTLEYVVAVPRTSCYWSGSCLLMFWSYPRAAADGDSGRQ